MDSSQMEVLEQGIVRLKAAGRAAPGADRPAQRRLVLQAAGLAVVLAVANVLGGQHAIGTGAGYPLALTPAFRDHLTWLNVWWGVALLLTLSRLAHGRWSLVLRWADLGVSLLGILVAFRILAGGPLLGQSAHWLTTSTVEAVQMAGQQLPLMNLMLRVALAGILLALIAGMIRKMMELVQTTRVGSWDVERGGRYLAGLALGLGLTAPAALLLGQAAYLGLALPLGPALGAVLDRQTGNILA